MNHRFIKMLWLDSLAFLQGVALVSIPSAAYILKRPAFGGVSDQVYGFLFLPFILGAIVSTWNYKLLEKKFSQKALIFAGLFLNISFCVLLAITWPVLKQPSLLCFVLCLAQICLGAGFGILLSSLNLQVVELYETHRDAALAGLHAALGIGSAAAPFLVNYFYKHSSWQWAAIVLGVVLFLKSTGLLYFDLKRKIVDMDIQKSVHPPAKAFLFIGLLVLYGISESIIGNWSSLYLIHVKSFSENSGGMVISVFWLSVTIGRLAASVLVFWIDSKKLFQISPVVGAIALFLIINNFTESKLVPLYLMLGLGCSYYFPFTIAIATRHYDRWRDTLTSFSLAFLMTGVGIGSSVVGLLNDTNILPLSYALHIAFICLLLVAAFTRILLKTLPHSAPL